MRVTRIGRIRPVSSISQIVGGGGTGGGPSGQVPTSNGSNGVSWGSNVAVITSNGSNALTGPFVNLISGSGISFSASSNSLTISATGTGSSFGGSLNDLSDVVITSATEDDDLRFNGTNWVNDSRKWEAVTDGEDIFVWEADDLVHEWST